MQKLKSVIWNMIKYTAYTIIGIMIAGAIFGLREVHAYESAKPIGSKVDQVGLGYTLRGIDSLTGFLEKDGNVYSIEHGEVTTDVSKAKRTAVQIIERYSLYKWKRFDLFWGIGIGFSKANFGFTSVDTSAHSSISGDTETFRASKTHYSHNAESGQIYAIGELGYTFRISENIMFQVAGQPTLVINRNDRFDKHKIPVNPGYRKSAESLWKAINQNGGWFFGLSVKF